MIRSMNHGSHISQGGGDGLSLTAWLTGIYFLIELVIVKHRLPAPWEHRR